MKNLIYIIIVCASGMLAAQTETRTFGSTKEYAEYAFSNTNLNNFNSGYLLNLDYKSMSDEFSLNNYLTELGNSNKVNGDKLSQMLHIMENCDVQREFNKSAITTPIYEEFYRVSPESYMDIPIMIFDMDFQRLKLDKETLIKEWNSDKPYPMFSKNDAYRMNIQIAGPFIKHLINPNVRFYWNNELFFTNKDKSIKRVELTLDGENISLFENETIQLFDYVEHELNELDIKIIYDDNTSFSNTFQLKIHKTEPLSAKSEIFYSDISGKIEGSESSTELHFKVQYACGRNYIEKPLIVVAGWGPYSDNQLFNNLNFFKAKWPATFDDLYTQFNNFEMIENMRAQGFDIIICKFFPPNERVEMNANALIKLIKYINQVKNVNGSREENVIMGYSAGSIATRLALLKMEYQHLNENAEHHQTKLYISFDGEHRGANIPLAAQHMVKHMYTESNWPNLGLHIDGLNQILEAPLTKELLHYYYTETGDIANNEIPHQGPHFMRTSMMDLFNDYNHSKNSHIPGYPSFTRNISIAQGANKGNYANGTNQQYPYPFTEGLIPYEKNHLGKYRRSQFNIQGGNTVFTYEEILNGNWSINTDFNTNNECLVIDNAPGGTVFVKDNPLDAIVMLMDYAFLAGSADIKKKYTQFCFTPTVFVHDIRNFDPVSTGYRLDYNMGNNNLMFTKFSDVASNNKSDFYGYPHLTKPATHYMHLTPFDAVFSSSINEEHLYCNRVERDDYNDYDEPYERVANSYIHPCLDFCLNEVDYENAYIQNENYGGFCRPNYTYHAKIHAPKKVFLGQKVTDRTDFKIARFSANSAVDVKAGNEIIIKPGTEVLAGTHSLFKIEGIECFESKSLTHSSPSSNPEATAVSILSKKDKEENWFNVYPNPSNGSVYLNILEEFNHEYNYAVYNLSGQLIQQNNLYRNKQELKLPKGVYIIKINNHEKSSTQRIIVL